MRVAVLDDYQNVAMTSADWSPVTSRAEVTVFSDPADPQLLGQPWTGEGLPLGREVWIENGVLKQLQYSRFWAQKKNARPNGGLGAVKMAGGTATTEEMIASTPRGILVTRLWYLRQVDPRTVLYTGLTRDGTFLIENGQIVSAVKNLRLTQSVPALFEGIELLGEPRLCQDWWSMNGMGRFSYVCPPVKVKRAVFSSGTLF